MTRFDMIAFDADDTLWHNERLFMAAQDALVALLTRYHDAAWIRERLYATEMRNMQHYGYGIKAFALSMIETAVELSEGRVTGHEIQAVIEQTRVMINAEIELLPQVAATIPALAASYRLMVITKGDLLDQESKMARSSLAAYFQHVEIVSSKAASSYQRVLARHGLRPDRFMMVGNSLRSDVLPPLELGAHAVYVPHEHTWAHELAVLPPADQPGFHTIDHLGQLPRLLALLEGSAGHGS